MQDLFEQVDEQLDAERVQRFWEKNHIRVIGGVVLLFVGLFIYVGWRDYRLQQDHAASEQFARASAWLDKKETDPAHAELTKLLETHAGHGYAMLSHFLLAKSLASAGKIAEAVTHLDRLAQEADLAILADLALLNAAYLTADEIPRAQTFLARMTASSPYQAHALELKGLFAAQQGRQAHAITHYRKARELAPEGTLRRRLENRLERLAGEKVS